MDDLLSELTFPALPKGRRAIPASMTVSRELGMGDIEAVSNGRSVGRGNVATVKELRHAHHQVARLLAKGEHEAQVSFLTGYNNAYISQLKADPAFRELMAYYALQVEQTHVDVLERMKTLGIQTLDELQQRLSDEPEGWSRRELMELADLTLVKPLQRGGNAFGGGGASGGGVNISVKFVSAQPQEDLRAKPGDSGSVMPDLRTELPVVDAEFSTVEGDQE